MKTINKKLLSAIENIIDANNEAFVDYGVIKNGISLDVIELFDQQTKENDELIKFLQDQAFNDGHTIECLNVVNHELREEIERLKESKWISVEVDLPKQENIYLVECKDDYTAKFNTYGNFKGSFTNCDNNGYDYEVYPTHWQPLPNNPI
jgi:hypothetical protein